MTPNFKCFFIVAVVGFLAACAWNDEWAGQTGMRVIAIAIVLCVTLWFWKTLENKGE